MITRQELLTARSVSDVANTFRKLGYPVELRPVSPECWKSSDLSFELETGWQFFHGCRVGPVDLFFLDGDIDAGRAACSDFVVRWRKWNVLTRAVVVSVGNEVLALHGTDGKGRARRLESSLTDPRGEIIDRLNLLQRRPGESEWDVAKQFERALERESVTWRFFDRFRQAVADIALELSQQYPEESLEAVRDEALLILSRILFLYFLQQKGWLDGNPRFLADQFERAQGEDRSCFGSVLGPLFFGCLNTPVSHRTIEARNLGRIPYLNGGLFEPSSFEQRRTSFTLSNPLLLRVIGETFEHYSFCIDEGDEQGVHVDPEMLGKVFESLMVEEERLASGSFYTPKPIVDSLARHALLTCCADGDPSILDAIDTGRTLDSATASRILDRLTRVRVIDPACGSGAFLLAALHVLEQLTGELSALAGRSLGIDLRQRIVENCLFGVDVKPEAVRLCELRLWLSIVSASSADPESVPPLPNLDRNILQGNALLGPLDFLGDGRGEIYRGWRFALQARSVLFDHYRHASSADKPALCRAIRESDQTLAIALLGSALKADREELERISAPVPGLFGPARNPLEVHGPELEARVHAITEHLARVQEGVIDFFAFDLHFAHVFADGGFDVVLSNPPWVRCARIEPSTRRMLADRYALFGAGSSFDQSDLCLAFWDKAFQIAAPGGVVAMLLPAKIATAGYARALRRSVIESGELVSVEDWSGSARELFDADTFPIALTACKKQPNREVVVQVRCGESSFGIPQRRLSAGNAGSRWQLVPPKVLDILEKTRERCPTLGQALNRRPLMGVKTGANERFFQFEVEFRNGSVRLPSLDLTVPRGAVVRCIRGRDVERWLVHGGTWMLLPPRNGSSKVPAWVARAATALQIDPREFRLAYVQPEHFANKIVWKDVSRGLQAVVLPATTTIHGCEQLVVPNQTLYLLEAMSLQEAFFLAGLLNSTIFNALVLSVADRAKDAHYRYFGSTVAEVPIPRLDEAVNLRQVANLSRRAHRGAEVMGDLDELVRQMYGLTKRELSLLASFVADRIGRA